MQTNVRDTSLEVCEDIRPDLPASQANVYDLLVLQGPLTNNETAKALGWEIN